MMKKTAEEILAQVDETSVWNQLIQSEDERIKLDALKYLTDRRDGKAPQALYLSGNPDENTPIAVSVDL